MSLYQKYRPTSFEEMIGNELAVKSLEKAIEKKDHSHVYLFTGPAGTGKTTAARIMANKLGAGELDIREVNTASNRGIDTARDIISQMRQLPMSGDCVVYILDEVHKFTPDMQNALLKPLEDTPDHVYFFLCTTDPQKLIKALVTRCTKVQFTSLDAIQLLKLLKKVNKLEEGDVSRDILEDIADKSEGCPRTALVILERVLSLETEEERKQYLKDGYFGEADPEVIELCRALLDEKNKWKSIATILKNLNTSEKLVDSEKVRYAVLGYMNAVLLNGSLSPRAVVAIEAFSEPTYNNGKFGITLACLTTVL